MNSTDASGAAKAAPQGAFAAPLLIIAGPTGAGKSALAMALAERHGARIISADSRQVYRRFDIGTAKPSAAERARVHHEGIDVAELTERWSAARWAKDAEGWLAAAAQAKQPAVIVGGTGLWLQALVKPLAAEPPMDPARRLAVQTELARLDTPTLRQRVAELDASRAHLGRTQLLRAAEVAIITGTRLSDWHARHEHSVRPARWLVVDPGTVLHERLDRRREEMLAQGWVQEVEALIPRVPADAPAWNACGYREIREAVLGLRPRKEALELVRIRTRQYAKRQRTWFRHQLEGVGPVVRLDPTAPDAADVAERWFTGDIA